MYLTYILCCPTARFIFNVRGGHIVHRAIYHSMHTHLRNSEELPVGALLYTPVLCM